MELKLRFTMDGVVNSTYERIEIDKHHRIKTKTKQNNTLKTGFTATKDTQRTLTLSGQTGVDLGRTVGLEKCGQKQARVIKEENSH